MPSPEPSQQPDRTPTGGSYLRDPLQTGVTIVGTTAVFGGIGWWIDSMVGTFPILMVLGAVFGLAGILYSIVLKLRSADNNGSTENRGKSGSADRR